MRLFGLDIRRGKGATGASSTAQLRQAAPQGPFSTFFNGYVPRKVSPQFYEVLREAVPVVGSAIRRLSSLTGTLQVDGDNAKLVDELREFFTYVPVNDYQVGIQSFLDNYQNEAFEQGFAIAEKVWNKNRTDIANLRVGDSKLIFFTTDDKGILSVVARTQSYITPYSNPYVFDPARATEQMLTGLWNTLGYFPAGGLMDTPLDMSNKMYLCFHSNNQDPYGESLLSSMQFVSKLLTTVLNQGMNIWERHGDPSYSIVYKSTAKNLNSIGTDGKTEAERREAKISGYFSTIMSAKRKGQSGDLVNVIDKDADFKVEVVGAEGKVLTMEVPYRICVEQIISKSGLVPWMCGISLGGDNAGGVKEAEVELVLSDAEVRKASIIPQLQVMARELLSARGRTWKPGDFVLSLKSPNLHDLKATAEANFLNAQARLMESGARQGGAVIETTPATGTEPAKTVTRLLPPSPHGRGAGGEGSTSGGEGRIVSLRSALASYRKNWGNECHCHDGLESVKDRSPEALQIMADYTAALKSGWSDTLDRVISTLGLPTDEKAVKAPVNFSAGDYERVRFEVMKFVEKMQAHSSDEQGPIVTYTGRAHALGMMQAASASGLSVPTLDLLKNQEIFQELLNSGFALVKDRTTLFYEDSIKRAMQDGVINGVNPKDIARTLRNNFDGANSDWERLARSEVTMAQETGKLNEWSAQKVKRVHFSPASGACSVCQALAGDYDIDKCPLPVGSTHPRCTCSITLADSELN